MELLKVDKDEIILKTKDNKILFMKDNLMILKENITIADKKIKMKFDYQDLKLMNCTLNIIMNKKNK